MFGFDHVCTLFVTVVLGILSYRWGRVARRSGVAAVVAAVLAVMLIVLEGYKTQQGLTVYDQSWQEVLPLHLCRISSYLCCLMLLLRSYRLFEVTYFWGIGGSVAAMLTPDLEAAFPDPLFLGFFVGHALVACSVLFAMTAFDFWPRLRSIGFVAVITVLYMGVVALINLALDTNYLYLSHKPASITVYQYLGPWPWYLLSVCLIGLLVSFLMYAPFARRRT